MSEHRRTLRGKLLKPHNPFPLGSVANESFGLSLCFTSPARPGIHCCCTIVPPDRNSGLRAGFQPDFNMENIKTSPSAGLRPSGESILKLSKLDPGRDPARKPDFRLGCTIAEHKVSRPLGMHPGLSVCHRRTAFAFVFSRGLASQAGALQPRRAGALVGTRRPVSGEVRAKPFEPGFRTSS